MATTVAFVIDPALCCTTAEQTELFNRYCRKFIVGVVAKPEITDFETLLYFSNELVARGKTSITEFLNRDEKLDHYMLRRVPLNEMSQSVSETLLPEDFLFIFTNRTYHNNDLDYDTVEPYVHVYLIENEDDKMSNEGREAIQGYLSAQPSCASMYISDHYTHLDDENIEECIEILAKEISQSLQNLGIFGNNFFHFTLQPQLNSSHIGYRRMEVMGALKLGTEMTFCFDTEHTIDESLHEIVLDEYESDGDHLEQMKLSYVYEIMVELEVGLLCYNATDGRYGVIMAISNKKTEADVAPPEEDSKDLTIEDETCPVKTIDLPPRKTTPEEVKQWLNKKREEQLVVRLEAVRKFEESQKTLKEMKFHYDDESPAENTDFEPDHDGLIPDYEREEEEEENVDKSDVKTDDVTMEENTEEEKPVFKYYQMTEDYIPEEEEDEEDEMVASVVNLEEVELVGDGDADVAHEFVDTGRNTAPTSYNTNYSFWDTEEVIGADLYKFIRAVNKPERKQFFLKEKERIKKVVKAIGWREFSNEMAVILNNEGRHSYARGSDYNLDRAIKEFLMMFNDKLTLYRRYK